MPYYKSFIDQVSSVKIAGYWPRSLLAFLWNAKRELGQYPAILTSRSVNNTYIYIYIYLTIIPQGRVGYEMIDSQRGA